MNTKTPSTDDFVQATKRRIAIQAAHVKRMAEKAAAWANEPNDDFRQYAFLDALAFCNDSFVSDAAREDMDLLGYEFLRIDSEGYPLNSDGYPIPGEDRVYIPLKAITAEEAEDLALADEPQTPWGPLSQVVVIDDEGNEWPATKARPNRTESLGIVNWVVHYACDKHWYFTEEGEATGTPYKIKGSRADGGAA